MAGGGRRFEDQRKVLGAKSIKRSKAVWVTLLVHTADRSCFLFLYEIFYFFIHLINLISAFLQKSS